MTTPGRMYTGGLPETKCGYGSTLRATENARAWLQTIIKEYNVKTFLDAPCGDLNWIRHMDWTGVQYLGIDLEPEYLPDFATRAGDLLKMKLPDADMMLCRDFLQHLTTKDILLFFANAKRSNIRWLVATSHIVGKNEELPKSCFRPLNLMRAPLYLSPPVDEVEDCGRMLGLWRFC